VQTALAGSRGSSCITVRTSTRADHAVASVSRASHQLHARMHFIARSGRRHAPSMATVTAWIALRKRLGYQHIQRLHNLGSADDRDAWYTKPWLELGGQECAWRSGVYLGFAILAGQEAVSAGSSAAPQEPPGKLTALGAHAIGTQRDVMASGPGRYVLVCHRLTVANSRSTY
jgi:hypothetical protein